MNYTKISGSGDCADGVTCEAVYAASDGTRAVVGTEITDPAERAKLSIGPGETAVAVSATLLAP